MTKESNSPPTDISEPAPCEIHIEVVQAGTGAVDLISTEASLSKGCIKRAMDCGAVWLTRGSNTQRLRRAKRPLRVSDRVHLYYNEAVLTATAPIPTLIADNGGYSVWDKPCRLYSQGSKWGDHCTVTRYAEKHLQPQRNAFVVHRLDRAASGLILVAHHKHIAALLARLFRERRIDKRYRVHTAGRVSDVGKTTHIDQPIDGKSARSHITMLEYDATRSVSILDVSIETGRKHQIRRHLAERGFPVIGDRLYGSSEVSTDLHLRAYAVSFLCPVSGSPVSFEVNAAPLRPAAGEPR